MLLLQLNTWQKLVFKFLNLSQYCFFFLYIYRSLLTWLRKMADALASLQKVKNKILERGARSIKGIAR